MEQEGFGEDGDDELSAMAWAVAVRGKSGREIAQLHESWSESLVARGAFDQAQVRKVVSNWLFRCKCAR